MSSKAYRNFKVDRAGSPQIGALILTGIDGGRATLRHYAPGMEFIGVVTSDKYGPRVMEAGCISVEVTA